MDLFNSDFFPRETLWRGPKSEKIGRRVWGSGGVERDY